MKPILFALFITSLSCGTVCSAVSNALDSGPGSLRQAITDSTSGDTITFDSGLSGQTITLGGTELIIDKSLTIDASALSSGITIDANGTVTNHRVLTVNTGTTVSLINLVITQGITPDQTNGSGQTASNGGGIYNQGNLTLTNCTVPHNSTGTGDSSDGNGGNGGHGGGIYSEGILTVINSTISNNSTGDGGWSNGIELFGAAGSAGDGGGIYCSDALTVNNSTIVNNSTGNGGFGTAPSGDAGFSGNGGDGGGVYSGASLTLKNSTISKNSTGNDGGNDGGNNQITFGGSGGNGGGIYASIYGFSPPPMVITNTVIARNSLGMSSEEDQPTGPDLFRDDVSFTSTGKNFIGDHSGVQHTASLSGILSGDPMLALFGNYGGSTQTMPPIPGSPLIDPTGTTTPVGTDQRGLTRSINTTDIGAVEIQNAADEKAIITPLWNSDNDGDGSPFSSEFALGTDPSIPDPSATGNLTPPCSIA